MDYDDEHKHEFQVMEPQRPQEVNPADELPPESVRKDEVRKEGWLYKESKWLKDWRK